MGPIWHGRDGSNGSRHGRNGSDGPGSQQLQYLVAPLSIDTRIMDVMSGMATIMAIATAAMNLKMAVF